MDESTLKVGEKAEKELAKIHQEEWQSESFRLIIGFMRNMGIGGLLIIAAFTLIPQIGFVEGSLLSGVAVLGLATAGRRLWRRLAALRDHPGGPTLLLSGARKSKSEGIRGDG